MSTTTRQEDRERRFHVNENSLVVEARPALPLDESDAKPFPVKLLDLSFNGVKFQCQKQVRFEEELVLHLCCRDINIDLEVEAEVRWIRPDSADTWIVGCLLGKRLSENCLRKLGQSAAIDRRKTQRLAVDIEARCMKAGCNEQLPIKVTDISEEGLRFECHANFQLGEPLRIVLDQKPEFQDDVIANVKWTDRGIAGRPNEIGCYISSKSATKYRSLIAGYMEPPEYRVRSAVRKLYIAALAIIATTTILLAVFGS